MVLLSLCAVNETNCSLVHHVRHHTQFRPTGHTATCIDQFRANIKVGPLLTSTNVGIPRTPLQHQAQIKVLELTFSVRTSRCGSAIRPTRVRVTTHIPVSITEPTIAPSAEYGFCPIGILPRRTGCTFGTGIARIVLTRANREALGQELALLTETHR